MPFIAHLGEQRISALDLTSDQWARLRARADYPSLVLPGCGIRAIAKTSSRGRQFFAHRSTVKCNEAHLNESPQHRLMKEAVARFIGSQPGWSAHVEYPGPNRNWVADVLAVSLNRRIAFEVQLTRQTDAEFEERSQIRFADGALPVWITPHEMPNFPKLPTIKTGFRKTSPLPESPEELLQEITKGSAGFSSIGDQILFCLRTDWVGGDVRQQREQRAKVEQEEQARASRQLEAEAEEQRRRSARQHQLATQYARSAFSPSSAHPGSSFPKRNQYSLWVAGIHCHRCKQPCYVWSAQHPDKNEGPPSPDRRRPEGRPENRETISRWHAQLEAPYPLAHRGRATSDRYSIRAPSHFACPSCRIIFDRYLYLIPVDAWLLIPGMYSTDPSGLSFDDMVARAEQRRNGW